MGKLNKKKSKFLEKFLKKFYLKTEKFQARFWSWNLALLIPKTFPKKGSPTFDERNKQRSEAIRIFIIREVASILQAAKSCVFILYCGRCCRAITSVLREEEHKRAPARAQKRNHQIGAPRQNQRHYFEHFPRNAEFLKKTTDKKKTFKGVIRSEEYTKLEFGIEPFCHKKYNINLNNFL